MVYIVIGANWGDEGKGRITDFLASRSEMKKKLVVRFNGGGQAGHTVRAGSKHHVFSNFGSGTIAGAETYYSKYYIVNPISAVMEYNTLVKKGIHPILHVDPHCIVTTPYDILINQYIETARGLNRHGSVGMGINETVTRSEFKEFHLDIETCLKSKEFQTILRKIQKEWVPFRINQLGLKNLLTEEQQRIFNSPELLLHFEEDIKSFSEIMDMKTQFADYEIIFEGAQGLLLDQDYGQFPYVTRSNTGLKNVIDLCINEFNIKEISPIYVTRPYITRHGAGPLDNELPNAPCENFIDETNIPHRFQGMLRFSYLDINKLCNRITQDLTHSNINVIPHIAITCCDQYNGSPIEVIKDKKIIRMTIPQLKNLIQKQITETTLKKFSFWSSYTALREPIQLF